MQDRLNADQFFDFELEKLWSNAMQYMIKCRSLLHISTNFQTLELNAD